MSSSSAHSHGRFRRWSTLDGVCVYRNCGVPEVDIAPRLGGQYLGLGVRVWVRHLREIGYLVAEKLFEILCQNVGLGRNDMKVGLGLWLDGIGWEVGRDEDFIDN